jgi:hypothetical protein
MTAFRSFYTRPKAHGRELGQVGAGHDPCR